RGSIGRTKLDVNFYRGIGEVSKKLKLLTTDQYLAMRREAYKNDGIEPNATPGTTGYAPDLTIWDQQKQTDWQEKLIGGTANYMNATASVSGGNENTQFLLGANYYYQSSVYPGDFDDNRGGAHLNITHSALQKKLTIRLNTS